MTSSGNLAHLLVVVEVLEELVVHSASVLLLLHWESQVEFAGVVDVEVVGAFAGTWKDEKVDTGIRLVGELQEEQDRMGEGTWAVLEVEVLALEGRKA